MLNKAKTLNGYKLDSLDGEIGKVKDLYFDDRHWAIRYLVADTGSWLTARKVLISPYALGAASKTEKHITVALTKKQIEDSPALTADNLVSRQYEEEYNKYYGWPTYWGGPHMWGSENHIERDREKWGAFDQVEIVGDPHIRSIHQISGHNIEATNGEIGHIEDFIIDDETWAIRYLIVNTRNWWSGKKVLISPQWIERVSWDASKVFVNLSRETIKLSPEYSEEALVTRDYETGLHKHYNREGYWVNDLVAK